MGRVPDLSNLNISIEQELAKRELSRRHLLDFTEYTMPEFEDTPFHQTYYKILDLFAKKKIKKLMVTMGPQHGKFFPWDTPVLTTKGWKKHIKLKPGDFIYGEDGLPKKVLNNFGGSFFPCMKVIFSNIDSIICGSLHEWKIKYDNGTKKRFTGIVETKEIMNRKIRRNSYIDIAPNLHMDEQVLPIDPYILGCWLGDGHSNQGVLTVGKQDIKHFAKYGEAREVKPNIYRVLIPELSKKLRLSGLIKNKHILEIYLMSSIKQRTELLQGIMDTDGHIEKRGTCEITQKRRVLSRQIYDLVKSLGYNPTFKKRRAMINGVCVGLVYTVYWRISKEDKVFKLKRKQDRIKNKTTADRNDKYKYFIKDVLHDRVYYGNCIQVEGGMYLVGKDLIPTHNSEGSSRRLPAYVLGKYPNTKIAVLSYAAAFAQGFNRDVQRIIDSESYSVLFPNTNLNTSNVGTRSNYYLRNSTIFEIVNKRGFLKAVGRGGPLTGNPVDMAIMDDLYKDAAEGNSPVIRDAVIEWYTSVVLKRLHNDSQQLIVFTRWHDEDLIGWLEKRDKVVLLENWKQLENINPKAWYKINFPSLMNQAPTELDPRNIGEPLYPQKHSREKLEDERALDPEKFESLNQGDPTPKTGILYTQGFKCYEVRPRDFKKLYNYTDVADTGMDYLCSINAGIGLDNNIYVLDVYYTQEPQEITEEETASFLKRSYIREAYFESNNGGRGFARNVDRFCRHKIVIKTFHQGDNKESRILTNAAQAQRTILMPINWRTIWPEFSSHLLRFRKKFRANKHDDCADTITGILEYSGTIDDLNMSLYRL